MDLGLKGKVTVVTAASGGIGMAIALAFAAEGARVALIDKSSEDADKALRDLRQAVNGVDAASFAADLTHQASVEEAANAIRRQLGSTAILVNAAGGVANFVSFDELSDDDWMKSLDLNLMTSVRTIRAFLPDMRAAAWGRIVNVATEDAVQPYAEIPHYSSAKAALLALSKSMSKFLARDGILVNAVSPAFIMTPLVKRMLEGEAARSNITFEEAQDKFLSEKRTHIELRRPGKPEEIAAAVLFLASERASFILGENIRVDGGSIPSI